MTQTLAQSVTPACWSCGSNNEPQALHCGSCGKLLPPVQADYFALFGLPRRLTLDVPALEKQFYRLSRRLHPDLYAQASEQERQWSLEKSSRLNDAWRTLRDPIARTEYLLELEGIALEEQSINATDAARASGTDKQQIVPPDMLEEVFELNMQLEEAHMAAQSNSGDPELAANLRSAERNYSAQMEALHAQLELHWSAWDRALAAEDKTAQDAIKQSMVALLNRRSYVRNLVRDVRQALDSIEQNRSEHAGKG
jgi:molecular chaperone HscB